MGAYVNDKNEYLKAIIASAHQISQLRGGLLQDNQSGRYVDGAIIIVKGVREAHHLASSSDKNGFLINEAMLSGAEASKRMYAILDPTLLQGTSRTDFEFKKLVAQAADRVLSACARACLVG